MAATSSRSSGEASRSGAGSSGDLSLTDAGRESSGDGRVLGIPVPHVHLAAPSVTGVPGRVLWLGGLAGLAVLGAIDWPVAGVVAVGAWVAEQRAKAARSAAAPGGNSSEDNA